MGRTPDPMNARSSLHKGEHQHPKKRFFRQRAHCNPLNDQNFDVPSSPEVVDCFGVDFGRIGCPFWRNSYSLRSEHYPILREPDGNFCKEVEFADIGCGFGGLLTRLAIVYPDNLILGMEIRDKVTNYVRDRILALRREHTGQYQNIACLRTNSQKYLIHYFRKAQLSKMFFLFPDPHFKATNHRRRIIQPSLLAEYAFCLKPGGMLYTITDVQELGEWMRENLEQFPLFERVSEEELESDPAANLLTDATEEGQKVARNCGMTWRNVYRRVSDLD